MKYLLSAAAVALSLAVPASAADVIFGSGAESGSTSGATFNGGSGAGTFGGAAAGSNNTSMNLQSSGFAIGGTTIGTSGAFSTTSATGTVSNTSGTAAFGFSGATAGGGYSGANGSDANAFGGFGVNLP